ncbi:MAG: two-component system, response regulator PdtaR [Solirubrobacteraceae bacterium]|jgi:response regulator NasT|nr:two-component system, response regulator PdtaR [Solirubrobacteraceae bacterium]
MGEQTTIETKGLRVLAADEDERALEETAAVLRELGHEVSAFAVRTEEAADAIAREDPDLSVVVVHRDDEHALDLIDEIVAFSSGPVVALLESEDPEFVRDAADRGIHAYARPITAGSVQSAVEVAMRRHAEHSKLTETVDQLEDALERRAIIERAKGVLMERHSVDERAAFELLRSQARSTSRPVIELARAVLEGHALLPKNGA